MTLWPILRKVLSSPILATTDCLPVSQATGIPKTSDPYLSLGWFQNSLYFYYIIYVNAIVCFRTRGLPDLTLDDESVDRDFATARGIPMRTPSRQTGTVRDTDEFDPLAPTRDTRHRPPTAGIRQARVGARVKPNNSRVSAPEEFDGPISFQTHVESSSPSDSMPEVDPYEARFDQAFPE